MTCSSGSASTASRSARHTKARPARLNTAPTNRQSCRLSWACWTNTGTNAAVLTVPTSRSYRMFGIVRAKTKASVPAVAPKVEAITMSRTRPKPRLRMLPRAITAAALATRRWVALAVVLASSADGVTGALCMWLHAAGRDTGPAAGTLRRARDGGRAHQHAERAGALHDPARHG